MRLIWLDYLRVLAAFAVVCAHVSSPFYYAYNEIDRPEWWFSNIINAASRFAVPIFVMISGSVLLGRSYTVQDFYRHRMKRIIPPLVFWSVIFAFVSYYLYGLPGFVQANQEGGVGGVPGIMGMLDMFLLLLITGSTAPHLWYLSMLVCLLLFVPFINKFINGEKPDISDLLVLAFLGVLFTGLNLIANIAQDLAGIQIDWFTNFPWYILYLVLGYLISRHQEKIKINLSVAAILIFIVIIIGAAANYLVIEKYSFFKDWLLFSNDGLLTFIIGVSVFFIFSKIAHRLRENRIMFFLSEASFGIYLIHPIFIALFQKIIPSYLANAWLYLPLIVVITFSLSFLTIIAMRQIPFLQKIC